jgi:succinate dehydrogenase/fumarate reductase flavoprotein subunit
VSADATLTIAGAGMAGLVAAARARELGARPVVLEKGNRPGGSMLLSSCVIWRYRSLDDFRAECPGGDPALQALIIDRLDDGLDWLESLGAPVVERETGNPRTVGMRFDPHGLTEVLTRAAGQIRLETPLTKIDGATILATGGFAGSLAERLGLLLRANRWSRGDGMRLARERGATLIGDLDEFYGRNLPAPPARITEETFVQLAQLYGARALVVNERGEEFAPEPLSWSETDLVQATARQPGARAWYIVDDRALNASIRGRTVAEMIAAAEEAGGTVRRGETLAKLGLSLRPSPKLVEPPFTAVHVMPGVTHTIGGLRVDQHARVLRADAMPFEDLWACGVDVGGIATGGYASGLAQALVLGLIAAGNPRRTA